MPECKELSFKTKICLSPGGFNVNKKLTIEGCFKWFLPVKYSLLWSCFLMKAHSIKLLRRELLRQIIVFASVTDSPLAARILCCKVQDVQEWEKRQMYRSSSSGWIDNPTSADQTLHNKCGNCLRTWTVFMMNCIN